MHITMFNPVHAYASRAGYGCVRRLQSWFMIWYLGS